VAGSMTTYIQRDGRAGRQGDRRYQSNSGAGNARFPPRAAVRMESYESPVSGVEITSWGHARPRDAGEPTVSTRAICQPTLSIDEVRVCANEGSRGA